MSPVKEEEWIRRTLAGDSSAFGRLYEAYRARIRAVILVRTRSWEDAEDLVQVTFMRAFVALGGFRGEAAFFSWLMQIARNVCSTHLRLKRVRQAMMEEIEQCASASLEGWASAQVEDPEEVLYRKQCRELLGASIEGLPALYRKAVHLRYMEERSYLEIAGTLRVPMGTVKTWLYRGRKQLQGRLR